LPRDEYQRIDLPVRVSLEAAGLAVLRIGADEAGRSIGFGLEWLRRGEVRAEDLAWLFRNLPLPAFVESAQPPEGSIERLHRVVLEIRGLELAELDWETLLQQAASEVRHPAATWQAAWTLVRTCAVRPRSATLPLTLPLRILQMQPRPQHPIPAWVRKVFGGHPEAAVERAVRVLATPEWEPPDDWPTVDVLHLDTLPTLAQSELALTTAEPERPGTLGWLARRTERWQTRLVVMHCETAAEAAAARRLAAALCDRGGPAVLVAMIPIPEAQSFYQDFYDRLIHDFALDHILSVTSRSGVTAALFAGAGREEGVRISNVGLNLVKLSRKLREETLRIEKPPARYRGLGPEEGLRNALEAVEKDWEGYHFSFHEGEGMLPVSRHLERIRWERAHHDITRGALGAAREVVESPAPPPQESYGKAPAARFVNSGLWREEGGELELIPQKSPGLVADEVVHLAVYVGPKDLRIETIDEAAVIEEVFKWSRERKGAWVEVAIAGIDFDVIGDPVQELWLPREDASEAVYFAVRPREKGIAQLRFGLYYENNLIQSHRLAAKVRAPDDAEVPEPEALAKALAVPVSRVGGNGYMPRLEYSRTSDLAAVEDQCERSLTVVANRLDGRDILTVKGADVYSTEVLPDGNMPNVVTRVRQALDEIAFAKIAGLAQPQYRFLGSPQDLEARCKEAISKLAAAGWDLFLNLAPSAELQEKINGLLEGGPKTIHVAHLLRDKVIPWAFVYDRPYNEKMRLLKGEPVEQGVCLAAVPPTGSDLRTLRCGEHAECLLNAERQAERKAQGKPLYDERTVACPLRFWGFRHVLEMPPQQVEDEKDAHEERSKIKPQGALRLAAGLNATLALWNDHWKELSGVTTWIKPEFESDKILELLQANEPDLIYFYCHARGGQVDPDRTYPPYLEFQAAGGSAGQIRPQDFGGYPPWSQGPLVFLNACGTLGYSPDALSPFLKALVDGRRASGVLGTEVPVAEALAGDFAREFLSRFFGGTSAGRALLEARRVLLTKNNPLGLVYTLFAPADLNIELPGKP